MTPRLDVPAGSPDVLNGPSVREHGGLENLPDTVARLAGEIPDTPAVTFLSRQRGSAPTELSYAQLDRRVRAVAGRLQRDCTRGSRLAVLCPHDADYVVAFLACLYAGMVAVPLYAPELYRGRERLSSVIGDCAPEAVLTVTPAEKAVRSVLGEAGYPGIRVLHVDQAAEEPPGSWSRPDLAAEGLAYLQYTSGSTSAPAGVRITHENLAATAYQMRKRFMPAATAVSWVPLFHDMGLISGIASPLSAGMHTVHLTPTSFIHDPYYWLRAISDYRADWSVTPNFGLAHCVARVTGERRRSLDLGCLDALAIGGEPIQGEAVDAFTAAFAEAGFRPSAPIPCYGLAEATLTVTVTPRGGAVSRRFHRAALERGEVRRYEPASAAAETGAECGVSEDGGVRLVGSGEPLSGLSVRIVDPSTRRPAGPDRVGEIWVRGPNCADGYWERPERSEEVFRGCPEDEKGPRDGWLRTGDTGCICDGQLFVMGRLDDLIIVRGRNHYPDDIESTVGRAALRARPSVFSVSDQGTVRVVVLLEGDRSLLSDSDKAHQELRDEIRRAVQGAHGIGVHDIRLVRRGTLPRTTSGKIQRAVCRERYLTGDLV